MHNTCFTSSDKGKLFCGRKPPIAISNFFTLVVFYLFSIAFSFWFYQEAANAGKPAFFTWYLISALATLPAVTAIFTLGEWSGTSLEKKVDSVFIGSIIMFLWPFVLLFYGLYVIHEYRKSTPHNHVAIKRF